MSSIALSSATSSTSLQEGGYDYVSSKKIQSDTHWLCTIDVEHTSSSTGGSPLRFSSETPRSACSTAPRSRVATPRHTSLTASSRPISSRIAGTPVRRSACCARRRSPSSVIACDTDASSVRSFSWTRAWSCRSSGFGGRGGASWAGGGGGSSTVASSSSKFGRGRAKLTVRCCGGGGWGGTGGGS